jgi:ATP-dependent Lhr-like helicase
VALYLRENVDHWRILAGASSPPLSEGARAVEAYLRQHGASFAAAIGRGCALLPAQLERVLGELVAAGRISSDSFAGLRDLVTTAQTKAKRARAPSIIDRAGRWSLMTKVCSEPVPEVERLAAVEAQARAVLARYGIVSRRVLEREALLAPWRDMVRILRRMEARGEVRGGYFVTGMSGEQYALPEALPLLRRHREPPEAPVYVALSAADPLNFTGGIIPGERIPAIGTHRILFCNALPVAVLEGRAVRRLGDAVLTAEAERLLVQSPGRVARAGLRRDTLRATSGTP